MTKMALDYFEKLWQESKFIPSSKDHEAYWDKTADCINAWQSSGSNQGEKKVIEFLMQNKLLQPNFSVLDIGCGPGRHTIEFAQIAAQVVGTDISGRALGYARKSADTAQLTNASFVKTDWEDTDLTELQWEKRFDLVFASMSPAINCKKTLEKMINASKGYCFYSYPMTKFTGICDQLANHLGVEVKEKIDPGNSAYSLLNMVYLLGYYPEVHYEDMNWQLQKPLAEAVDHYSRMLSIPNGPSTAQLNLIKQLLAQQAENGIIKETNHTKIAWINWKVSS